jgi:hypothetical protein
VEDCSTAGSFPVEALGSAHYANQGPILLVTSGFSSLALDAVGVNTGGRLVDHERRAKLLVGCTACDANPRKAHPTRRSSNVAGRGAVILGRVVVGLRC